MTPKQFDAALTELGWTQKRLARLVKRHENRVSDWATAKTPIPPWVELILTTALEIKRLNERLFPPTP